jgi:serine/threonine-protein kinase
LTRHRQQAINLMRAMAEHVDGDGTNWVQFGEAAGAVTWLHAVAAYTAGKHEWDLLEEAIRAMCEWDGAWDQWRPQDKIRPWLRSLNGDAANVVASALRDHPHSARHFAGLDDDRGIRQAVLAAADRQL